MRSRNRSSGRNMTGVYVLIVMAVIFMALSVALIIGFPEDDYVRPSSASEEDFSRTNGFACDLSEAKKLYPLGNGLLKLGRERVSYLDLDGNEVFGETIDMTSPVCHVNRSYALIADTEGTTFVLLSTDGLIFQDQVPYTIDYGNVSSEGFVAVIYDNPGTKGTARFYDPDGQMLFEWESVESGYIVSAGVSPSSDRVDASVYNTDSAQPYPILKRFSPAGEAVAQFFPETEEILPRIVYDTSGGPVLCGAGGIIKAGEDGFNLDFSRVFAAESSEYGIIIVARKETGDIPKLYILSDKGGLSEGIIMSEEITCVSVQGDHAAVGLANSVVYADIKQMKQISVLPVDSPVIRTGFDPEGNKLIVVSSEGVSVYKVSR